jgi:glutamate-1-semialdehyde 2,1-aminomutase
MNEIPKAPAAASGSFEARPDEMEFFERELSSFVPDRIFDSHCHLWPAEQNRVTQEVQIEGIPDAVGYAEYRQLIDVLHPGRLVAALFIPLPGRGKFMEDVGRWMSSQTAMDRRCRGEFYVQPEDDPEWLREQVRAAGLHGLKCYHTSAPGRQTWDAEIPDYLPEPIVRVAHEEEWVITLHLVRARGVADASNIHWIRHFCKTYPNMKLILAHSARGFQPAHCLEGLEHLRGLDNLFVDTSANCEAMAHIAVLKTLGHRKLLYGSDFYVSHLRGRPVAASDSFLWLSEKSPVWGEKHVQVQPVLIGLEHLRSLKWACYAMNLHDNAVEDLFWNNAAQIFKVV